jgi:hypothetical protein
MCPFAVGTHILSTVLLSRSTSCFKRKWALFYIVHAEFNSEDNFHPLFQYLCANVQYPLLKETYVVGFSCQWIAGVFMFTFIFAFKIRLDRDLRSFLMWYRVHSAERDI